MYRIRTPIAQVCTCTSAKSSARGKAALSGHCTQHETHKVCIYTQRYDIHITSHGTAVNTQTGHQNPLLFSMNKLSPKQPNFVSSIIQNQTYGALSQQMWKTAHTLIVIDLKGLSAHVFNLSKQAADFCDDETFLEWLDRPHAFLSDPPRKTPSTPRCQACCWPNHRAPKCRVLRFPWPA